MRDDDIPPVLDEQVAQDASAGLQHGQRRLPVMTIRICGFYRDGERLLASGSGGFAAFAQHVVRLLAIRQSFELVVE